MLAALDQRLLHGAAGSRVGNKQLGRWWMRAHCIRVVQRGHLSFHARSWPVLRLAVSVPQARPSPPARPLLTKLLKQSIPKLKHGQDCYARHYCNPSPYRCVLLLILSLDHIAPLIKEAVVACYLFYSSCHNLRPRLPIVSTLSRHSSPSERCTVYRLHCPCPWVHLHARRSVVRFAGTAAQRHDRDH